jgi:hypothetical protein
LVINNTNDLVCTIQNMRSMKRLFLILSLFAAFLSACEKDAGPGGTSTITGRVKVLDYNAEFTHINEVYWAQKEEVFIVYGNDSVYSESFKTNYDGTYRFEHLQKGKYQVFCYSKDTTGLIPGGLFAVIKDVNISDNGQEVRVEDIVIVK